ncbi:MAG: gamma-glutamyl-gamma-aminobutyrate hydrolase family protein, partial [Actinobacteria bacterium]|nr:gamma-glutamyl-gamma-aminobutyrate hydrolase family protein [Actinomycetota bacterium]
GDIDPAVYGEPRHPRTGRISPERDRAEFALLAAALAAGLPVLAICRGLQVLNVFLGGTLHQHLADLPGPAQVGHIPPPGTFGSHRVRISPGSRLAGILGADGDGSREFPVPTAHHQAIDRLGDGLIATAWAADGVIEAVELAAPAGAGHHPFVIAVQWHPEAGGDLRLAQALVAAARGMPARHAAARSADGAAPAKAWRGAGQGTE